MKRFNYRSRAILATAAAGAMFSSMSLFNGMAHGASFTWTGATDANLSGTAGNWNPSGAPAAADITFFAASAQTAPQTNANVAWLGMTFNADAPSYTFGGTGSVLLGNTTPAGGTITNNSSGVQTFNVPMAFRIAFINSAAGDLTFTNTFNIGNNPNNNAGRNATIDGSHVVTISGPLTGTTATSTAAPADGTNWGQLIKNGSGTLILSNDTSNATYTGRITVNAGALQVLAANALGANGQVVVNGNTITAGSTRVGGGTNTGRVELLNNLTYATETLALEARSVSDAQLVNLSGNNTWTGPVSLLTGGGTYAIQSDSGALLISGNVTNNTNSTGARSLVIRGASNGEISGNIVEAGSSANLGLIKEGAGVWTLSGANTYTGPTSISAGTLNIGNGGANGSFGTGAVANEANLVFNRSNSSTVNNAISGNGSVFHAGSGATTLAGSLTYTGSTTVQAGTLAVPTSKSGGGAIFVAGGAALTLNSSSPTSSLATSALTTGASSILNFNLGAAGNPTAAMVNATGLTRNGTSTINILGSNLSIGTVTLVQYGSAAGGSAFALGTMPGHALGTLFDTGTKVDLNITSFDVPRWTGALSNTWDATVNSNPKNWVLSSNGVTPTDYIEGDSVLFNDSSSVNTVNITATVSPSAITVNNSSTHDYTFGGAGRITGVASLTKTGNGTLTIANDGANDFSGAISIGAGGTLAIGAGTTSGSVGAGAITDNGVLALNRSDGGTIANSIGGTGGLVASGGGTWVLTSDNAYAGTTSITGGTLQLGAGGTTGSAGGGNIGLANGATLSVNRSSSLTLSQSIDGSGNLSKNGSGTLVLSGSNTFDGVVALNAGVIRAANSNAFGTGAKNIVVNTRTKGLELDGGVTIPASVSFNLSNDGDAAQGATVAQALRSMTGTNTVNGPVLLQTGGGQPLVRVDTGGTLIFNGNVSVLGGSNARTFMLGGTGSGAVNGVISDGQFSLDVLSVQISGAGLPSWTFTNANTYTGFNSINSGTLTGTNSSAFGTGTIFIGNGGAGFAGITGALNIGADQVVINNLLWTNKDGASTGVNNVRTIGYTGPAGGTGGASGPVQLNGGVVFRAVAGGTLAISGVVQNGTDASTGTSHDVLVNAPGGTVSLTNANFYGGITQVDGGNLLVANVGALSAGSVTANAGGTVTLQAALPSAVKLASLTLNASGSLGLTDNDVIVSNATAKSAIEGYVAAARNAGAWNQAGLTSSTAAANTNHTTGIGVLSGAEYTSVGGAGNFSGVNYGDTDTLVKYTWNGDANLDGRITFDDYVKIDTGFNTALTGWLNGDFNYSGSVNFDDYVLIDIAFNQQSGTLGRAIDWISGDDRSASGLSGDAIGTMLGHLDQFGSAYGAAFLAAVPEPSALLVLGAPALVGIARRRRRRSN